MSEIFESTVFQPVNQFCLLIYTKHAEARPDNELCRRAQTLDWNGLRFQPSSLRGLGHVIQCLRISVFFAETGLMIPISHVCCEGLVQCLAQGKCSTTIVLVLFPNRNETKESHLLSYSADFAKVWAWFYEDCRLLWIQS